MAKPNPLPTISAPEAEASVIGAILTNPQTLDQVQFLTVEDFYDLRHQLIYRAALRAQKDGKTVDIITVIDILKRHNKLKEAGGSYYLTELPDMVVSVSQAPQHAAEIRQKTLQRRLQRIGLNLTQHTNDLSTILTDHQKEIQGVLDDLPVNSHIPGLKLDTLDHYITDMTEEPPHIIARGILPQQSIMIIGGQPKAGKSILALNTAWCISTGHPWLHDFETTQKRVLVLQAENSYHNQKKRLKMLYKATESEYPVPIPDKGDFVVSEPFNVKINEPSGYMKLINIVKMEKPQVLIIDPLVHFHSCDENDNAAMGDVMEKIRTLTKKENVSVIIVHHTRKPGNRQQDSGTSLRGASSLYGAVDTSILIGKEKDTSGKVEHYLDFDVRNGEQQDRIYVEMDLSTLWFEKCDKTMKQTLERWITDVLVIAGANGIKQSDIVANGKEKGFAERSIQRKITAMINSQMIKTDGKMKQRILWYHTFYEDLPF